MLERAALNQTRFRTPGVSPDPRGIVLGHKGAVLFPSLDRLVAFLRAYGEDSSLDDLLASLSLKRVVTPLKTREMLLLVNTESSYRMDRIASIAKLAGGLVFTGTSRHFVKYRDAASPLGYDVEELLDEDADIVLYHDEFLQAYSFERDLSFRELVMKLEPVRLPPAERQRGRRLFVTAEMGIGAPLVAYLFRWQVMARAAVAEWPSESAFDDSLRRLYLFDVENAPERIVKLLSDLPGVHVFEPVGKSVAVELGFRHPIALESCQTLFDNNALVLFLGNGQVLQTDPTPPFAPVGSLIRNEVVLEERAMPGVGAPHTDELQVGLPLRLDVSQAPWRNVVASIVPRAQRHWLARILYKLPLNTLGKLQLALSDERVFLLAPAGIEGVPLGVFYSEVAKRIYVPSGMTLVPAISTRVLESLAGDRKGGHVFFEAGADNPIVVPASAFGPVSAQVLREVEAMVVHAEAPERYDRPLGQLSYGEVRRFPLWGVPQKDEPLTPAADETEGEP